MGIIGFYNISAACVALNFRFSFEGIMLALVVGISGRVPHRDDDRTGDLAWRYYR